MKKDRTVYLFLAVILIFSGMLLGFGIDGLARMPESTSIPAASAPHYPTSMLDGKPMAPSSIHLAHGTIRGDGEDFQRDDGVTVKLFLTGASAPESLRDGMRGTIEVSVPSYDDDDEDETYYFRSWTPDAK